MLTFNANLVDWLILIFLLIFVVSALNRGFLANLVNLIGFLFSFLLALKFYPWLADLLSVNFNLPLGIARAVAFLILCFVTETVFFLIIRLFLIEINKETFLFQVNKLLGPLPSFFNGLLLVTFFLNVLISLPISPQIKKEILQARIGWFLISHTQSLETELRKIFGQAVLEGLSFVTINPASTDKINLSFKATDLTIDEEGEEKMLFLINQEREKNGLRPLVKNFPLQKVARQHAFDMLNRSYFSHFSPEGYSPFDRLVKNKIDFLAAGENLALAPTVELAHQGLLQSLSHRQNILSPEFGQAGIGVIDAGSYGKVFVQLFIN